MVCRLEVLVCAPLGKTLGHVDMVHTNAEHVVRHAEENCVPGNTCWQTGVPLQMHASDILQPAVSCLLVCTLCGPGSGMHFYGTYMCACVV